MTAISLDENEHFFWSTSATKYIYAINSPLNNVDPSGKFFVVGAGLFAASIFGPIGAAGFFTGIANIFARPDGQSANEAFVKGFVAGGAAAMLVALAAGGGAAVGVGLVALGVSSVAAGIAAVSVAGVLGYYAGMLGTQLIARSRGRDATERELLFGGLLGSFLSAFGAGAIFSGAGAAGTATDPARSLIQSDPRPMPSKMAPLSCNPALHIFPINGACIRL